MSSNVNHQPDQGARSRASIRIGVVATATMLLSLFVVAPRADAAAAVAVPEVDSCTLYEAGSNFVVDWDAGDAAGLQTVIYRSVNGSADYWRGRIDTGTQFVDTRRTGVIQYAVAARAANGAKSARVPCAFGGNTTEPIANGPAGDPVPITSCTVELTSTSHIVSWVRPDEVPFDHVIYRSVNGSSRYWRARTGSVDKTFTDSRTGGSVDYFVATRASDGDRSIQVACTADAGVVPAGGTCSVTALDGSTFVDNVYLFPKIDFEGFDGGIEMARNGVLTDSFYGLDDHPLAGPTTYHLRSRAGFQNGIFVEAGPWATCGTVTVGSVDAPASCSADYVNGDPAITWTGGESGRWGMWRDGRHANENGINGLDGNGTLIDPESEIGVTYTYAVGAMPAVYEFNTWPGVGEPVGLLECGSLEGTRDLFAGCDIKPGC